MLARLELSEDEKERFTEQLNSILEHAEALKSLDTEGVEPTAHSFPIRNVFREDAVKQGLSNEVATANAPDKKDGYFKVPKIV
jgi:aspartyl-tRNA(Asn)/glutamyl-tRNA(Gln) amidotransferase subunit C